MAERTVPHAYPMSTQYELNSPSCIYDQTFGEALTPQDLLTPTLYHGYYVRPRITKQLERGFSQIEEESGMWRVQLDVCQFTPDELTVRTVDNLLEVTGNHSQKQDAHGFVSRSFTRAYILPAGVDPLLLQVRVSHDGILTMSSPRATPELPVTHLCTIHTDKAPKAPKKS
ncbi:heat shock protein beta-2 [Hypomesus transpacificus]|uniref:heat shock protein beta-2 n=1 Tax=Hypomesus transpacificus TaxID=137520 RepID=UPI001F07F755|nr:heat shock protein beta-2 [Hypomesus transpacificus]